MCHVELDSVSKRVRFRKCPLGLPILVNSKAAFTLAEVLITLGIIGVVAAMTIPGLMTAYKAHRLRSQFLKSYSTVQQVFKQMEADDVSLNPKDYKMTANDKFYKTFMKYLQAPFDCGYQANHSKKKMLPCYFADESSTMKPYVSYDGKTKVRYNYFDDGQIAMQDGTLMMFENEDIRNYIWVHVDLNGYNNLPNRLGYDLFTFEFLDGELRTMGSRGTSYSDLNSYCNPKVNNELNGIACAHKAKNDTEYFKWVVKNIK